MRRDLEGLFAVIWLGNQQIIDIHAEFLRIHGIERVFYVDECRDTAAPLRFGRHLQRDGGLTRRFRTEDFVDASTGESAHAESGVEGNGTGRDHRNRYDGILRSQTEDRSLSELLLDLSQSEV